MVSYLQLPENRTGVPVVVVPERDVFDGGACVLQLVANMHEEPRLVPAPYRVHHPPFRPVAHPPRHDHPFVLPEHDALHELVLLPAGLLQPPREPLQPLHRFVLEPHVLLGLNDPDFGAGQEAQAPVGPGDRVEEVRVLRFGTGDRAPVGEDQLEGHAGVLEEAVPVGRRLDPGAHDEAAHGEVVHLGEHWDGPTEGVQGGRQLAHRDHRLDSDGLREKREMENSGEVGRGRSGCRM